MNFQMVMNRWPRLLISVALLIGFGACCKQFDLPLKSETRAMVSILFGFAISGLLLSFIWIIQKKPVHDLWSMQPNMGMIIPSMNPRGSIGSLDQRQDSRGVCTISALIDLPPDYKDALINSKPIDKVYLECEKFRLDSQAQSTSAHSNSISTTIPGANLYLQPARILNNAIIHDCLCSTNKSHCSNADSIGGYSSAHECMDCKSNSMPAAGGAYEKNQSGDAHLAYSIVGGFATLETQRVPQQTSRIIDHVDSLSQQLQRKISYRELDINNLDTVLSESPPRYSELDHFGITNCDLSNNSNEPRAGQHYL